jgi:hypothetical protein
MVIIKLSINYETEYNIYKLLKKLKTNPNIPYIYGKIQFYEKNEYLLNNFQKLVCKRLCNISTLINFSIIERINYSVRFSELSIKNIRLSRIEILSLLLQGLYAIYNMFYMFGILYNDFSKENILLKPCDKSKTIIYEFDNQRYRYFNIDFDFDFNFEQYNKQIIETNGVQLYLIDFYQSTSYYKHFINLNKIEIHPIDNAYAFIKTICKNSDNSIYEICEEHFKIRGKHLIWKSQFFIDAYLQNPTYQNNYFMIDKMRLHYKIWIKELFKLFPEFKDKGYGQFC